MRVAFNERLAAGAALFALAGAPAPACADTAAREPASAAPVEVAFRGCDAAGWCLFSLQASPPSSEALLRVRPAGLCEVKCDDAVSIGRRDRLNALLASMIHQAKRIALYDLHALDDGTFTAAVTVNGLALASDPDLVELCRARTPRPCGTSAATKGSRRP
jgi:hypothetical protein